LIVTSDGEAGNSALLARELADARAEIAALKLAAERTADVLDHALDQAHHYRTLTEHLQVGVLLQGPDAEMLTSNPRALELLGLTQDQLLGRSSFDPSWNVIHEDGTPFPGPTHPVPQAIATRRPVRGVVMGVHRPTTSDRVWLLVDAIPELESGGDVRQVVCTFTDITDRKRVEEALLANRAMLARAEAVAHMGSWEWDAATDTTRWSDELFRIFRRDPAKGAPSFAEQSPLYDAADMARLQAAVEAAIHEGTPYELELRAIREDGESRVCLARGHAEVGAGGKAERLFGSLQDITDRKRVDASLAESAAFLSAIVDSTIDLIWSFDRDFRLLTFNRAYSDHFLKTRGIRVRPGLLPEDLLPADHAERMRQSYRRVFRDGPYTFEFVTHERSRTLELSFNAVTRDGAVVAMSAFGRDITARKRAEDELRTLSRAVEQSPASIVITDRLGNIEYVSPRFEQVTGYASAEVVGKNPRILKSGVTPAETYVEMWRAISEGGEWRGELCNRRKNGELFWEYAAISGLKDADGRVAHYVAVKEDISDRRRAEDALRESEARLREVLENSLAASYKRNLITNSYEYFSPVFAKISGYTPDEMAKLPLETVIALMPPEDTVETRRVMAEAMAGPAGEAYEVEYRFRHKNGAYRWLQDSFSVLRDADGRNLALIGSVSDITERKQAEQEQGKLEAQLQQAQKMESVGRLAGGVAHDFNNMLGVILGHTDLAQEQVDEANPLYDDLAEIRNAAMRSADLTRQLLAFARKQTVEPKVLDLNDTVAGMLKMLQRLIGENIHLDWAPEADLWLLKIDPSQIDQVLANLCVNARDAIGGIGTLTIATGNIVLDEAYCATHPGCSPGEYVRLVVVDDGCGMDEATLASIFEPFFTTKGVGKGTGLGLSTVYGVVKQNDGFISVESAPSHGTKFAIHFPRHRAKPDAAQPDSSRPSPSRHETILVVEDERVILRLAQRMLAKLGYEVLTASTPGEAIGCAKRHVGRIDLLLTDVIMPEMNGRELAKLLLSRHSGLRRLYMSGYTADVIADQGVLEEGTHFLQKPFTKESLAAKVREVLDGEPPS
jgi:PAS domain S-box-containing protein